MYQSKAGLDREGGFLQAKNRLIQLVTGPLKRKNKKALQEGLLAGGGWRQEECHLGRIVDIESAG